MASYQVMYWKHIPSQVKAWDGEAEAKRMLPDYFQAAIDAYATRIHAIASGENPSFGFFTNDEDDFSGIQLESALEEWIATRSRLIDYVRALDGEQRGRLTGHHERYGEVTVERYLEIALEHDQDHLRGLERLAGGLTR